MNCVGTEPLPADLTADGFCCIVGYGNSQRRDDGLGPRVAAALKEALEVSKKGVRLILRHQLEPDLAEELSVASEVILVDATAERLPRGWRFSRVAPRFGIASHTTHSLSPGHLVGLIDLLYQRSPPTWILSIQGDDFGFGEGLSPGAAKRARRAVADLIELVSKED